jgi:hypothetical protein
MEARVLDPKVKALEINLDKSNYGSLAEIGAGQEVAAFLFKAGAASQTIAKTISAYDMTFSDAIYGREEKGRYVCEARVMKMLNREYTLLENRLKEIRGKDTRFFAFADTVVTINYAKTNQGQGWMGLRFQTSPETPPNDLVVHIRLMEKDANAQQAAVGVFGINMIYGCYNHYQNPELLLLSLMDSLSTERIKIDMIRFSGPDFEGVDNRLMALRLVQYGFTNSALFDPNGDVKEPADVFYKKHILAVRGRFRPCTVVNLDMFKNGVEDFVRDENITDRENIVEVAELTLSNLRSEGEINYNDFLERVNIVSSMGKYVLISNYQEYYRLVDFFNRYTKYKFAIVLGPFNLADIFNEKYYTNLKGGILESFSALFSRNVRLYIYPAQKADTGVVYNSSNFEVPEHLLYLYKYLLANDKIKDISSYNSQNLHIYSDKVLDMIRSGESGWETMVPENVEEAIKSKKLFGYKGEPVQ